MEIESLRAIHFLNVLMYLIQHRWLCIYYDLLRVRHWFISWVHLRIWPGAFVLQHSGPAVTEAHFHCSLSQCSGGGCRGKLPKKYFFEKGIHYQLRSLCTRRVQTRARGIRKAREPWAPSTSVTWLTLLDWWQSINKGVCFPPLYVGKQNNTCRVISLKYLARHVIDC